MKIITLIMSDNELFDDDHLPTSGEESDDYQKWYKKCYTCGDDNINNCSSCKCGICEEHSYICDCCTRVFCIDHDRTSACNFCNKKVCNHCMARLNSRRIFGFHMNAKTAIDDYMDNVKDFEKNHNCEQLITDNYNQGFKIVLTNKSNLIPDIVNIIYKYFYIKIHVNLYN